MGKMTLEEALEFILKEKQCYSEELLSKIVEKRKESKRECFKHLHPEILPMLKELKKKGIAIGLISNCFSEEAEAIKKVNCIRILMLHVFLLSRVCKSLKKKYLLDVRTSYQ